MKVGTDAVLLGAWANPEGVNKILDIGTGTGIIALMLAQKSDTIIDAIDIDKNSCKQAQENVDSSKWNERIFIHYSSLQDFAEENNGPYELIISNPPYFIDSSKSSEAKRTTARHADVLTYEHLLNGVLKLLSPKGRFYIILPSKEGEIFRDMAESNKLFLCKLTRVRTREDKTTDKRLLMCFGMERKTFSEDSLTIELNERHNYTTEYKELTKDYYLGF